MKLVQTLLEEKVTTTELMRLLTLSLNHLDENIDQMVISLKNIENSLNELKNKNIIVNQIGGTPTYAKPDMSGIVLVEEVQSRQTDVFIPSIDTEGTINAKSTESKTAKKNFKSMAKKIKED